MPRLERLPPLLLRKQDGATLTGSTEMPSK